MANQCNFAKFVKIFHHQNFALYSMCTLPVYNAVCAIVIIISDTMATLQLQPGPMQGILKGLVEGLVQASSGQQLSRAYLYGSLLYYLQLTNEQTVDHLAGTHCVCIEV